MVTNRIQSYLTITYKMTDIFNVQKGSKIVAFKIKPRYSRQYTQNEKSKTSGQPKQTLTIIIGSSQ